jgi:hypothetical protein
MVGVVILHLKGGGVNCFINLLLRIIKSSIHSKKHFFGKKKNKKNNRARAAARRARAAVMKRQRLLKSSLHAHHDSAKGSL